MNIKKMKFVYLAISVSKLLQVVLFLIANKIDFINNPELQKKNFVCEFGFFVNLNIISFG